MLNTDHNEEFRISRPLGTGRSIPSDVLKLRRALMRTGHGRFPPNPAKNVTPGLMQATKRFQQEFGLKPDSVVNPGGPTERMIGIVDRARKTQGDDTVKVFGEGMRRLAAAGLKFEPDPENAKAGIFRDGAGNRIGPEIIRQRLEQGGEFDVAAADPPAQDKFEFPGRKDTIEKAGKIFRKAPLWQIIEIILQNQKLPEFEQQKKESGQDDKADEKETVPESGPQQNQRDPAPEDLPRQNPPFPAEPPKEAKPDREEFPADEEAREPTILVNPIPDLGLPEMTVFPDQSDVLEQWLVMESRGKKDGQQKDVQFIIDELYGEKIKCDLPIRLVGGGRLPDFAEKEGKTLHGQELKEKVIRDSAHEHRKGGGKLRGSARPDISIQVGDEIDHHNVTDTLKDGVTPDARERRNFEKLVRLLKKKKGLSTTFGKSKGQDQAEWEAEVRAAIMGYVKGIKQRLKRQEQEKGDTKPEK